MSRIHFATAISNDRLFVSPHMGEARKRLGGEVHRYGSCRGCIAYEDGERADGLVVDEIRRREHIARHRREVSASEARGHLDAGVGGERGAHRRIDLTKILMGEDNADLLLARLGQDDLNLRIILDVVVAFVDVDEAGETLVGGDAGALRGGLIDEGEKEAAEEFGALVLEQSLLGVDEDHFAGRVDLGE